MAPVTATPVATITATPVAPQTTLPTNAMGSPPHLTEVSRPGSRTPLRPLVIKWELVKHPDKAFVEQLIKDLVHGCSMATMDLNFQQLPSTSAQPCSTQALSTKVSKKRQK